MNEPFPICRHGGEETSPGLRRCRSDRLAGLRLVTPPLCDSCACRDHEPDGAGAAEPAPHLLPCAHLGPAESDAFACSHPRHGRTTPEQCRRCGDYLFPFLTPHTPVEEVMRLACLPGRPQPDGWWLWPNVHEAQRRLADAVLAALPERPDTGTGRGIVIAGGGRYFASAYVTARVLRHVGCRLPIQLWHLAGEIDAAQRDALAPLGVECIDAHALARERPYRFLTGHWWQGWQLKAYAILHCPFQEVLYLDADSYPTRDPAFLFDEPRYRDWGAVFWPDGAPAESTLNPVLWDVYRAEPEPGPLTEAGQMVIHKALCHRELQLAAHLNAQADFVYRLTHGDKDTFTIAWRRLGRRFWRPWPTVHCQFPALLQCDSAGRVLFQHRALAKFTLGPEAFPSTIQPGAFAERYPFLEHEEFCFGALEDLKRTWLPWWHRLAALWHPEDPYRPDDAFRRHYQAKHDLAARLRPRRIAEIGVRAGYAAYAMLSAVPDASYVGFDADVAAHGGEPGFFDYAATVLRGFDVSLVRQDTRQLDALPGRYDLVHVDGDHSYEGCLHDLHLACRAAPHVLVDDYDFLPEVRRACDDFVKDHPHLQREYIADGLRGLLLLSAAG
jgi:hypothetical protein